MFAATVFDIHRYPPHLEAFTLTCALRRSHAVVARDAFNTEKVVMLFGT